MSREPKSIVEGIKKRITELHRKHIRMEEENAKLRADILLSKNALDAEKERVRRLESELETVKLAKAYQEGEEGVSKESRAKINAMVKEIDRCIALLND